MTRDEIIRMAREAGGRYHDDQNSEKKAWSCIAETAFLEHFAALVAEHEREHGMKLLTDVLIDAAVKAEREACAKVCESLKPMMRAYDHRFWDACHESAAAIRARGQQ